MCTCSYSLDEFKEEGGDVQKMTDMTDIHTVCTRPPLTNALLATPPRACPYCEDCVLFSRLEKNRLDFMFTLFKIRKFNNQAGWKTRWVRLILVVDARTFSILSDESDHCCNHSIIQFPEYFMWWVKWEQKQAADPETKWNLVQKPMVERKEVTGWRRISHTYLCLKSLFLWKKARKPKKAERHKLVSRLVLGWYYN